MSKWLTIDEMITTHIDIKRSDPFYNSQQFPRFMRRKALLPDNYDRKKNSISYSSGKKPFKRRTVSEQSPSQTTFTAYGRVIEQVKCIYEKETLPKDINTYDEALTNQEFFTKVTPKHPEFNGEYRYSSCPRDIASSGSEQRKKNKKMKSFGKIPHKISTHADEKLKELTQSNILVLLSKSSPKKCLECNQIKCECILIDKDIPDSYFDNIKKGKELINKIKTKTKNCY